MKTTIMTLHLQSSLHAGSGQSDGVIDLPVQREAHTGYPCIFGSSMKGALRSHAEVRANIGTENLFQLFGMEQGDGNAGAILVSDARLLLLPIRSLTGQFRWATCPAVLKRYKADCQRFGKVCEANIPQVEKEEEVLVAKKNGEHLYLEEYCFRVKEQDLTPWLDIFAKILEYDNAREMLERQLVILHDDDFAYLVQYTLPVLPHIAIDSKTKTTKNGALWYEESLPPDSVLYVGIAADEERKKDGKNAEMMLADFKNIFGEKKWLQVGGNETVGMGWCSVKFA